MESNENLIGGISIFFVIIVGGFVFLPITIIAIAAVLIYKHNKHKKEAEYAANLLKTCNTCSYYTHTRQEFDRLAKAFDGHLNDANLSKQGDELFCSECKHYITRV